MVDELEENVIGEEIAKSPENTVLSYSSTDIAPSLESKPVSESQLSALFKYYESKFEGQLKKQDDKIENQKLSVIETLGIFVALFTFISVDFQVFKSYRDPVAIGALIAIFLGSIFIFVIFLDYFILQARRINKDGAREKVEESKEDKRLSRNRMILFAVSLGMIIIGLIAFCFFSSIERLEDDRDQIKKEILSSVQSDLDNQKNELEKINNSNGVIIKNTNDSMVKFKECIRDFGFTYKCFKD